MADNAVAAAAPAGGGDGGGAVEGQGAEGEQAGGGFSWQGIAKTLVTRMLIMYFISSLVKNWRGQPDKPVAGGDLSESGQVQPAAVPGSNLWMKDQAMDLYVYLTENEKFKEWDEPDKLLWHHPNLIYGDWTSGPNGDGSYTFDTQIECSESLQNNGSIYLHVYVTKSGVSPNPKDPDYQKRSVISHSRQFNKYKKKRYLKTANLLTGKTDKSEEEQKKAETIKAEILNHWHPNLTLNMVVDHTNWVPGSLPPPLDEAVRFDHATGNYYPIFFFNDYWNLGSDHTPINDTVPTLNISLTYSPMSLFKWQMYASQQMRNKWTTMLGGDMMEESDDDQDSLKQAILDTNPILLGLTIAVSLLHTVFEFLAFKNDIQFWRSRKSLEGLSVRSIVFNVFTQMIVLLYVMDNETNFIVKFSIGIGVLIELWKIPKVMDVSINREDPWFGFIPRIEMKDKGSYVESSTKQYDRQAFKYLGILLFPLLAGYAVYSVLYNEHKGWYSFVLSMLYGFLLTFGFIMMTPQLFINYKLKSVAHLPWRMLSYKFLNTFIDDIFAFVIKMPTLYRIGCFRDDIVFLIYVYQRYIYRVDPTRMNEFGTSAADPTGERAAAELEADPNVTTAALENSPAALADADESKKDK